jgi:hypothetical protein
MHAELAAVPNSLYHVTRANRVIASVSMSWIQRVGGIAFFALLVDRGDCV